MDSFTVDIPIFDNYWRDGSRTISLRLQSQESASASPNGPAIEATLVITDDETPIEVFFQLVFYSCPADHFRLCISNRLIAQATMQAFSATVDRVRPTLCLCPRLCLPSTQRSFLLSSLRQPR